LLKGSMLINRECAELSDEKRRKILDLTTTAFFEISKAETKEIVLRGKRVITPREYLEIMKLKTSVPKIHCEIGAILGNGNENEIKELAEYGRTFGIVSLTVEEFADLLDLKEFENRMRNECPPLPYLYAISDPVTRGKMQPPNGGLTQKELDDTAAVVLNSPEVKKLCERMKQKAYDQISHLAFVRNEEIREELATLLLAPLSSLECSSQ